jgi:arsenate reductase (glutaredoxin)
MDEVAAQIFSDRRADLEMRYTRAMAHTIYVYAGCSTCKKALKWLKEQGIEATVVPIVESPPSAAQLTKLIAKSGKPASKWWNTSGEAYRALIAERGKDAIAALTTAEVAKLLSENGKRIKRPVLVQGDTVLVGFDPTGWSDALLR